ncbi:MAG: hypothetical protein ABIJ09_14125 [Pseudomonadota bacterium]
MIVTSLVLAATLAATPMAGPDLEAARAQARRDRDELAGWLRGTRACQGGRVARHLADMLRARGLDAEFHPAGVEGGYTVAHSGPRSLPIAAVLVAEVTACPDPPDDRELQAGEPARLLWRAALVAAAVSQASRRSDASQRVVAVFLGGDGSASCGRDFVAGTWPGINAGAPVLDVGGVLRAEAPDPGLLLEVATVRPVSFELRAVSEGREAGEVVDRALALLDGFQQVAPADSLRDNTARSWARAASHSRSHTAQPALTTLTHSQCTLGPRLARDRAKIECRLAPGYPARQLAFDMYLRVKKLPVVLSHDREVVAPPANLRWVVAHTEQSARAVWPGLKVEQGYQIQPPCAESVQLATPTLGLPIIPDAGPGPRAEAILDRGADFAAGLAWALCGPR